MGRVDEPAADGRFQSAFVGEEAVRSAVTCEELDVADVAVGREQASAVGIGAGDQDGRNVQYVRRQTRRHQLLHELLRRNQYLASQVTALFRGRQLIFEVNAGRAGLDHGFHQLESVKRAAKAGFGV